MAPDNGEELPLILRNISLRKVRKRMETFCMEIVMCIKDLRRAFPPGPDEFMARANSAESTRK